MAGEGVMTLSTTTTGKAIQKLMQQVVLGNPISKHCAQG
jgi:hypothetical protein